MICSTWQKKRRWHSWNTRRRLTWNKRRLCLCRVVMQSPDQQASRIERISSRLHTTKTELVGAHHMRMTSSSIDTAVSPGRGVGADRRRGARATHAGVAGKSFPVADHGAVIFTVMWPVRLQLQVLLPLLLQMPLLRPSQQQLLLLRQPRQRPFFRPVPVLPLHQRFCHRLQLPPQFHRQRRQFRALLKMLALQPGAQ